MIVYSRERPKVFLLAVHLKSEKREVTQSSLSELESLARTLEFDVARRDFQTRDRLDSKTYIGTGKLEEVRQVVENDGVDLVLFDHDLSPNQGKFLENFLGCMVWDRTQMILEIFAGHARTPESKNQVELAQLKYMLPRLVGMWAHLDREKGGISASRGAGEKQIAIDRKLIGKRIAWLEKRLKKISGERAVQSRKRFECFQVGVVGYTNAGKTSLINQLTGSELRTEDKLFATLESATRVLIGLSNPKILISDTVGFIRNLPHNLIASFRSTLDVVRNADLLLHVVDASSPNMDQRIQITEDVLREIGAGSVPRLLVLNKMDRVRDRMDRLIIEKTHAEAIPLSVFHPEKVSGLKDTIKNHFLRNFVRSWFLLPYDKIDLLSKFYQLATVEELEYAEEGVRVNHTITPANKKILNTLLNR